MYLELIEARSKTGKLIKLGFVSSTQPTLTETLKWLLKLNLAIDMYRNGLLYPGAAVEFVGEIDRHEFLYECRKRGVEPQTYENVEELEAEVTLLAREQLWLS